MNEGTSSRAKEGTTAGSYFVSNYPPYSFWNSAQVKQAHAALDRSPRPDAPLGVYVHIPFCRKRCHFCYFKVYTDKDSGEIERYLDAVIAELKLYSRKARSSAAESRVLFISAAARHLTFQRSSLGGWWIEMKRLAAVGRGRGSRFRVRTRNHHGT